MNAPAVAQGTAAVPAAFSGLKKMDSMSGALQLPAGLGRFSSRRVAFIRRARIAGVRNMAAELQSLELEPASQGSPLLGMLIQPLTLTEKDFHLLLGLQLGLQRISW